MKFHNKVFMANEMAQRQEEIKKAVKYQTSNFAIHVITIPPGTHQLEIFPVGLNAQPAFNVENHLIVGVAGTYSETLELMEKLSQLVFEELGVLDFRRYFNM